MNQRWHVVQFEDDGSITRVWKWDDWLNQQIHDRPENVALVNADDELQAFTRVMKGEFIRY